MKVEQRVLALVTEKIADRPDLFLLEIKMQSNGKLSILVDGDKGVAIQDCVAISRHVGFHLEEENLVDTAYTLEVSSPGVDFPLTQLRQYVKNVGRNVSVKFKDGNKTEGKLAEVHQDQILLQELKKEKGKKAQSVDRLIPFNEIAESKVLISFK